MFESLLTAQYDSYHPAFAQTLVNSVKSYINSKLDYERTPEFITEVRRRLYLLHEYNCQVAKLTHKYPRSKKFDSLLVKYVELEFEVLYYNNPHPPKHVELITELRVLRLLQVMLYQAVLNDEPLINENTDAILKRAVLGLLCEVKSVYLTENKLICNIVNKILKKIDGNSNGCSYGPFRKFLSKSCSYEAHKNLATSDYGTDDSDSDFDNDYVFSINGFGKKCNNFTKSRTSDCMEVPVSINGAIPIPTIEFVDDDDDSYMVFLQEKLFNKNKSNNAYVNSSDSDNYITNGKFENYFELPDLDSSKRNLLLQLNLLKPRGNLISNGTNTCKKEIDIQNVQETCTVQKVKNTDNYEESCIIVCSDSEDDLDISPNSEVVTENLKNKNDENIEEKKNVGVVTFEIIDDDDDNDQPNYMVYLQKEVKTNTKLKKIDSKEIIICSDSEDEESGKVPLEQNGNGELCSKVTSPETQESKNNPELSVTPDDSAPSNKEITVDKTICETLNNVVYDEDTVDIVLQFFNTNAQNNGSNDYDNHLSATFCEQNDSDNRFTMQNSIDMLNIEEILENRSKIQSNHDISLPQGDCLFVLENEVGLQLSDNITPHFAINPELRFEEISYTQLSNNFGDPGLSQCNQAEAICSEECFGKTNSLGGPVLSEKMDDFDDIDDLLECRINDSLLEELLLDDSYLLEGRKEFEDLECFLFNNSKEEQGFYNMPNFSIDSEGRVEQSESVNENLTSMERLMDSSQVFMETNSLTNSEIVNGCDENLTNLECLMDNSQVFMETNSLTNGKIVNGCDDTPVIRRKRKYTKRRKSKRTKKSSGKPLKDFTNSNIQVKEQLKANISQRLGVTKNSKDMSWREEINFKSIPKQKPPKVKRR